MFQPERQNPKQSSYRLSGTHISVKIVGCSMWQALHPDGIAVFSQLEHGRGDGRRLQLRQELDHRHAQAGGGDRPKLLLDSCVRGRPKLSLASCAMGRPKLSLASCVRGRPKLSRASCIRGPSQTVTSQLYKGPDQTVTSQLLKGPSQTVTSQLYKGAVPNCH